MNPLLNDPTLLGAMLALCGAAVLACVIAATRALWRFWRERKRLAHNRATIREWEAMIQGVIDDPDVMDGGEVHAEHVSDTEYKGPAVPYASGSPVRGAPVTRAEFDAVLARLAILEGAKRGMREQLRLGWSMMSLRGLGGYNGMNPAMRRILDHPPATESDSEIRVWEWNSGHTSPTNWLWDGKKMWHRGHVFPWGDALTSTSPARLLETNAHLDVRELHSAERARVIADWRKATNA